MAKVKVSIQEVAYLCARRAEINSIPFEDIEWVDYGKERKFSKTILQEYKFTGLNNTDFVRYEYWNRKKIKL